MYREYEDSTKKALFNKYSKVSEYKICIKNQVYFCMLKISWQKIKNIISFTVLSILIKYLEINLTKNMKDLYTENGKTLLKEI